MDFQMIWRNIIDCEGQEFTTITGLPFTYRVEDNYVIPDRTEYPLAKSNFEKAAAIKNLQGPGQINFISRGPSYVYAILTDKRIKTKDATYVLNQNSEYGSRNRETLKYNNVVLALIHEGTKTVVYTSRHVTKDIEKIIGIFSGKAFNHPRIVINPAYIKNPSDTYFSKCDFDSSVAVDDIRNALVNYYVESHKYDDSYEFETIKKEENEIQEFINEHNLEGIDKVVLAKSRINQGVFRERLIRRYKKCCLCGADNVELLISSHIKPWSESSSTERTDVNNGLLLCPNHDRLFDKGYISFDANGQILISTLLDEHNRIFMNVNTDMSIDMSDQTKSYMEYHRLHCFKE